MFQLAIKNNANPFIINGGSGIQTGKLGFNDIVDNLISKDTHIASQPLNLNRTSVIQLHSNLADGDTLTD